MSAGHKTKSREKAERAVALGDCAQLARAIKAFVEETTDLESSVPIADAVKTLNLCTKMNDVFLVPLRRQLFGLNDALTWAFFLSHAGAHAVSKGDPEFSAGAPFSVLAAHAAAAEVYDLGMQGAVWSHFESDDEEDEEEDEEPAA